MGAALRFLEIMSFYSGQIRTIKEEVVIICKIINYGRVVQSQFEKIQTLVNSPWLGQTFITRTNHVAGTFKIWLPDWPTDRHHGEKHSLN